jgi:alpha-tubulin suppressor-like RCC1 family protein
MPQRVLRPVLLLLVVSITGSVAAQEGRQLAMPRSGGVHGFLAAGGSHTLLVVDGEVLAWGENGLGELGNCSGMDSLTPTSVTRPAAMERIIAVAAGENHSLALTSDGAVWAWGSNANGRLGNGQTLDQCQPVQVATTAGFTGRAIAIAAGDEHSLALTVDGMVWAWGNNSSGRLGDGTTTDRHSPVPIPDIVDTTGMLVGALINVKAIAAGGSHSMALNAAGEVYAWGDNNRGQLGNNNTPNGSLSPTAVATPPAGVIGIASGGSHSLALADTGEVWSWGANGLGQLGDNNSGTDAPAPTQVTPNAGFVRAVSIAAGADHSLALTYDGKVFAWGKNQEGQLGGGVSGAGTESDVPLQANQPSGWVGAYVIAAGADHNLALNGDGDVWAWGAGGSGRIGDNATSDRNQPVQVSSIVGNSANPGILVTDGGWKHSFTLLADGTLESWGQATYGVLGTGSSSDSATAAPVIVSGGTPSALNNVIAVASGGQFAMALRSDGTLWGWGRGDSGQLTQATTARDNPAAIQLTGLPGHAGVKAIAAGTYHSLALLDNGELWSWGRNTSGQLGHGGTTTFTNLPMQVGGPMGIISMAGGDNYSLLLKSDGTVASFGADNLEQLGNTASKNGTWCSGMTQTCTVSGTCPQGEACIEPAGLYEFNYALTGGGKVLSWGFNITRALGYGSGGTTGNGPYPDWVKDASRASGNLEDVKAVAAGGSQGVALIADGTLYSWGRYERGALGNGLFDTVPVHDPDPDPVPCIDGVVGLHSGNAGFHVIIRKDDWSKCSVGANTLGQLEIGTFGPDSAYYLCDNTGLTITPSHNDVTCSNGSDGSASISVSGGSGSYVYKWTPGGGLGTNEVGLKTGTHLAAVCDDPGKETAYEVFEIGEPDPITTATITPTDASCAGGTDGEGALSISGNPGDFTFLWSNGSADQNLSGANCGCDAPDASKCVSAGDYTVVITETATGDCQIEEVTIGETSGSPLTTSISPTDPLCNGGNGTIDLTINNGTADYCLLWSDSSQLSSQAMIQRPAQAGFYTVDIVDARGCTASDSVTVGEPPPLSASTTFQDIQCTGEADGSIDLTVAGGSGSYVYDWSNGATTEDVADLPAGTYSATVEDSNGCPLTPDPQVTLTDPPATPAELSRVSGGRVHSLVRESDGSAWTWGSNGWGQLGDGTRTDRHTPIQVKDSTGNAYLQDVLRVAAGGEFSLALIDDPSKTVRAWGQDFYGQLGDGASTKPLSELPVQVGGLTGVDAIAAGFWHALALKSNGEVWAWGRNNEGQLGDGTIVDRISPVQVSGLTAITAIAAGIDHGLALDGNGDIWAWGDNSEGQLGDGTTTDRLTPVMVSGLSGVTIAAIGCGGSHSLAVDSTGAVWAWGWNIDGQLGDGTVTASSTPLQVSGISGVVAVAGGDLHSVALRDSACLSAWGGNSDGQLGDGTTADRFTPVKVKGPSRVKDFAAGDFHGILRKSDENICTVGLNDGGQLGDGTTTDRSSYDCSTNGGVGGVGVIDSGVCLIVGTDNGTFEAGSTSEPPSSPNDRSILDPAGDEVPVSWTRLETDGGFSELSQLLVKGPPSPSFNGPSQIGDSAVRWIRQEGQPEPTFFGVFTGDRVGVEQSVLPQAAVVTDASVVTLEVDVRVDFHNLGGSGADPEDSEYPVTIDVDYRDSLGSPGTWSHGWYVTPVTANHDPNFDFMPGPMTTADFVPDDALPPPPDFYDYGIVGPFDDVDMLPPPGSSTMVEAEQWVSHRFDLFAEIPDLDLVETIRIEGRGWSYQGSVDNVSLKVILPDLDQDGTPDGSDGCPSDPEKVAPGQCGCGVADIDGDGDGTADCNDLCAQDPGKAAPGVCGCGVADTDGDGDGTEDCIDACPADAAKTAPGICGCGVIDDGDTDGFASCLGDCDDSSSSVWDTPGEVEGVLLDHDIPSGLTTLSWTAPVPIGGAFVLYDVLVSVQMTNFNVGVVCVESNDGSDTVAVDPFTPSPSEVYYYLVGAENTCPIGFGTLGTTSLGLERSAQDCLPPVGGGE